MQNFYKNFLIFGAGSWGTALACHLAKNDKQVVLYTAEEQIAEEIKNHHRNHKYLPDINLPDNIDVTNDFGDIKNKDVIVIATPSHAFHEVIHTLKNTGISGNTVLLIATKGLANNPVQLFSQLLQKELPKHKFAFIAGPNFAKEVAQGLYTLTTIASTNLNIANNLADNMQSENFVINTTGDIITIQLAGIIKNIVAIKSGIDEAEGKKENARAALIIQALKEIETISKLMGGQHETLSMPGVLGDLMLTCYSKTSRNMRFGFDLATASDKKLFLVNCPYLVEGRESINALTNLIKSYNLHLPIINSVFKILNG